ncbi:SH3 domain-containing protein [Myxacorys almedinensis]|uniref:SH3 domain-containing protein n=1 Tax=Myxacorys almedinensis A TaxID=2690445 RepID=A0A8J7ZAD6_9CYAN|nr:SH3 domain-containing protein [Myxacorys almedinensis]NDJ19303.1 SH3 domain-containing protein [Myxacorys almedinensis A]
METFAYLEAAVAHEDPSPDLQVRSLKDLGLTVPAAASVGLTGLLLATTLLVHAPSASAFPAVVTASGLNIRSGPGTGYAVIGGLSNGQTVEVSDVSGGWYRLSSGGWIASNYTSASGTGGGGAPIDLRVRVTGSVVNVRNGPGTGYSLNGRPLYLGEVVRVVRSSGGWYQLTDGGWFSDAYATTAGGGTGGGGTPVDRVVTVTGSVVNVRNGPGTGYSLNGRPLYLGERVRVVRSSGGWYQLTDGGWFSGSFAS